MHKFYVESGPNFKMIVTARNPIHAILRAFDRSALDDPLRLATLIIVNQRGFVWDRTDHELHGDEFVIPTRLVLGSPTEEPAIRTADVPNDRLA